MVAGENALLFRCWILKADFSFKDLGSLSTQYMRTIIQWKIRLNRTSRNSSKLKISVLDWEDHWWVPFVRCHVVGHFWWQALPKITKMANMALWFNKKEKHTLSSSKFGWIYLTKLETALYTFITHIQTLQMTFI